MKKNILVAYFSAEGTTEKAANILAETLGADKFKIQPKTPYSKADLNWTNKNSRSSVEMKNKSFRPAILEKCDDMDKYDVVFLGFPIWWYEAPTIINTFLESHDFSNKKIILFATSGGSGFGRTADELRLSVSESADIEEGMVWRGRINQSAVEEWVKNLKY